jgi:hypothetical protein
MRSDTNGTDRVRALLVLIATLGTTVFNALAATGHVNGITPEMVSAKYPTVVTPAGYAFSIWSLIYVGLLAFSVYQLLPAQAARLRSFRTIYILSCVLNCAWLYCWHHEAMAASVVVIAALWAALLMLNIKARDCRDQIERYALKAPFGLYFGWVTAAALINFAVLLVYLDVKLLPDAVFGSIVVLAAAAIAIVIRIKLRNFFFPLAVAWALTAIAVKQGGHPYIISAAALGVIICLVTSLSFIVNYDGRTGE